MWFNLIYACRLPLGIFIVSIWESFCKVGQPQNDHFDVVLQSMQKDHGAWFKKNLPQMLKVGIRLTWSKMTICKLWLFLFYLFYFPFHFSVCLWTKDYCFGFKVISHHSNTHSLKIKMHMRFKNASFCWLQFLDK